MDIREIKLAKTGLERKIAQLLRMFEEETHAKITSVGVQALPELNLFLDSRHTVSVRIEL